MAGLGAGNAEGRAGALVQQGDLAFRGHVQGRHVTGDGPAQLAGGRLQPTVHGRGEPGVDAGQMEVEIGQERCRARFDKGQGPGAVPQLGHQRDGREAVTGGVAKTD